MEKDRIAETAKRLGITEAQVREVLNVEQQWTTTVNTIVTHTNGTRHWSSQPCQECQS